MLSYARASGYPITEFGTGRPHVNRIVRPAPVESRPICRARAQACALLACQQDVQTYQASIWVRSRATRPFSRSSRLRISGLSVIAMALRVISSAMA